MYTTKKSNYTTKTIRPGDDNWFFTTDDIVLVPRAGFEINPQCPREYKMIIAEYLDNGWLKPVAYIKESELMFDILTEGN